MRNTVFAVLAVGTAALASVAGAFGGSSAQASGTDVSIAFSTWNGYLGLVVASKEGYFAKHGINLKYSVVEDPTQRFNALKAGRLDAIATTVDTFSRETANGVPTVMVLGLDASVGGDGIVAQKGIKSIKQLKGQTVGVSAGSTDQWLLAYALNKNGMSLKDVKQINMTSGDAGAAFAAGRVPVAVTWQPWLDRAKANPKGHVLLDTKRYPSIIVDEVAFAPSFVKEHPATIKAFIAAYGDALELLKKNPKKAFADVTDYLGQTPAQIKATMKDVPLWSLAKSRAYYGTPSHPGPIYKVYAQTTAFWKSIGEIKRIPSPKSAIDGSFMRAVH